MAKTTDKINELEDLRHNILDYAYLINRTLNKKGLTNTQEDQMATLHEIIGRQVGHCVKLITELTGLKTVDVHGKDYDMWVIALKIPIDKLAFSALTFCLQVMDRAIGQLEEDIKSRIRDNQGKRIIEKPVKFSSEPPKAFIAHGGRSGILNKLREFIEALGIKPIIVELSPSKGMTVDEKVSKYIKDADFGIVLATKGGIIDTKGKETKQHPRLNVIDELERLRAAFPNKTILLLEKGVDLPSNISGLTHEPFVGQSMDRAFTAIARELVEFGILRTTKPQE